MPNAVSRRDAMKRLSAAGAGAVLAGMIRGQDASGTEIVVAGRPVEIAVFSVSPSTIRIAVLPLANGEPSLLPYDGALVSREPGPTLSRQRSRASLSPVRAGELTVRFVPDPPTLLVQKRDGATVQKLTLSAERPGMSFLMGTGPLLGLGQGGPQFDRRGTVDIGRSGQAGYRLRTHGGRVPIQWLIGTEGWGMYIHQPLGAFDFTGAEAVFTPFTGAEGRWSRRSDPLPLDVFIVSSNEPATILGEYVRLTGYPELPPLWSLGYMQSHRTLSGPEEVMWVARTLREKRLPCDALIYLGTGFTPSGWNIDNGEFAWNTKVFPSPKDTIDTLHAMNYKVVLHVVIEGERLSGTVDESCTPENAVPSGRRPDGEWPADRNVACYWPYHKPLFDLGVDGFWPDQGDGLDAPSRLDRIRMYWEGSQKYRPDERPFALHRNGYAGMARYSAFLWSGDVFSQWETLKTHVAVAINSGLSGIPYWGTDIGGFVPTKELTGELYVRWFQFGAFCPSFRAHGRTWHLRLPWGWNTGKLGHEELRSYSPPAAHPDSSELRNPEVEPICRKYLELRYRLLPYTYTAVRECHDRGLPIIRSLWLHDPDDPAAVSRGDEYLWGPDILVCPVTEQGARTRTLYLPRGGWFDFWTEERIDGGREVERTVDLATLPLYVRAGAVLPLGPIKQHTAQPTDQPTTLVVYPGSDGFSTLYEDDGRSFAYRKGEWMRIEMVWRDADRLLTLRLAPGSRTRGAFPRRFEVKLAGAKLSRAVVFDGRELHVGFKV